MTVPTGGEIKALTGLRFIAATAVVLHHVSPPAGTPTPVAYLIMRGYVGVPLFFMLSGLVLAWNYPNLRLGREVPLFYVARIARVMPLYWVMLAYLVVVRAVSGKPQNHLWAHVLGVQAWSGDMRGIAFAYNPPGWSICVELFLYAAFPFLIPLVAMAYRRGVGRLLLIVALALVVQWALVYWFAEQGWADLPPVDPRSGHRWLYRNPLTRLPDFVIGMCLAFLIRAIRELRPRVATMTQLTLAVVIIAIASWDYPYSGWLRASYYGAIWSIPFGCLLLTLAIGPLGVLARLLSTRPMLTLGTASYAVYLTHSPLLSGFRGHLVRNLHGPRAWLLLGFVLLLVVFVAEGAHRYVEIPARTFIVGWARRWFGHRPPPPIAVPARPPAPQQPGPGERLAPPEPVTKPSGEPL